jgi:hypothetical protein
VRRDGRKRARGIAHRLRLHIRIQRWPISRIHGLELTFLGSGPRALRLACRRVFRVIGRP